MAEGREKKSVQELLAIFSRRRGLFLLASSSMAVVLLVATQKWPAVKYEGVTVFDRSKDPASEDITVAKSESFETTGKNLDQVLKHQSAMEEVIETEFGELLRGFPRGEDGKLTEEGKIRLRRLTEGIREDLKVEFSSQAGTKETVHVRYESEKPDLAYRIPNAMVKKYFINASLSAQSRLKQSLEFLENQVGKCQREYEETSDKRIAFLRDPNNVGLMLDRPGGLEEEHKKAEETLKTFLRERNEAKENIARLMEKQKQLEQDGRAGAETATNPTTGATAEIGAEPATDAPPEVATHPATRLPAEPTTLPVANVTPEPETQPATREGGESTTQPTILPEQKPRRIPHRVLEAEKPNPKHEELSKQLIAAKETLDMMLNVRGMKDKHPSVEAQQRAIAELEQRLKDTPKMIVETTYVYEKEQTNIGREMTAAQVALAIEQTRGFVDIRDRDIRRQEAEVATLRAALTKLHPAQIDYDKLSNKEKEREGELIEWRGKQRDVQMAFDAEVAKRRTVLEETQQAVKPYAPSSPTLLRVAGLAIAGALAFGAAVVFLVTVLDRSIVTSEDATEVFDVPVHGVIGEIITPARRVQRALRRWIVWTAVSVVLVCALAVAMLFQVGRLDPQLHKKCQDGLPFNIGHVAPLQNLFEESATMNPS